MNLLDAAFFVWLIAGTFALKWMHRDLILRKKFSRSYFALGIFASIAPLALLRSGRVEHTAISVILAGLVILWFGLLTRRIAGAA